jgi:hypothetical protein
MRHGRAHLPHCARVSALILPELHYSSNSAHIKAGTTSLDYRSSRPKYLRVEKAW